MKVWVLHEVDEGGHSNYKVFREDHPPSSERIMQVIEGWGYSLNYAGKVADHFEKNNEWSDIDVHISLKLVDTE